MPQAVRQWEANALHIIAPFALDCGQVYPIGTTNIGVYEPLRSAATNEPVALTLEGAFLLPCLSTDTGSIGLVMYWDTTNLRLTTTAGSNVRAGRLAKAKLNGETTACIMLNLV